MKAVSRVILISGLCAAVVTHSEPARAWTYDGVYRPRRHHRRIHDTILEDGTRYDAQLRSIERVKATSRQSKEGNSSVSNGDRQQRSQALTTQVKGSNSDHFSMASIKTSMKKNYKKLQRAFFGEETPVYSVGISARSDPKLTAYSHGEARRYYQEPSPITWIPVMISAVLIFLIIFGKNIKWPWTGKEQTPRGRWIRDRSLGGKMVFIPDTEVGKSTVRPLWTDDDSFGDELEEVSSKVSSISGNLDRDRRSSSLKEGGYAEFTSFPPEWWAPPRPALHVPQTRRDELRIEARKVLKELEDAKVLRGMDYSLASLVRLRGLCHDGGGLQVRPSTESGRDSMLRAAVKSALENPRALGHWEPARFISGLAHDLGIPDKRAVTIVHAMVAAECRGALIGAEAGFRAGSEKDVLESLDTMLTALNYFPLPPYSAEAELVGRSIQSQTSLDFRRSMFLAAGSANIGTAPTVATMLGFEPKLVMPNLMAQLPIDDATTMSEENANGE